MRGLTILLLVVILTVGCAKHGLDIFPRESKIPANATKLLPEMDVHPPILHSDEFDEPVPLPYPINTKGAEDSAFIIPDGNTLYIFFTPDVTVPVERQLIDGVTGIYFSRKINGVWQEPERAVLNDDVSLDGCEFVQGNTMWFCPVRAGNYREIDIWTAEYVNGKWTNWKNAGERLNKEIQIGEMHITADGNELYYHTRVNGTVDIYVTKKVNGEWQDPEPVEAVNTNFDEGWPYVSQDGNELWFNRGPGAPSIYRSKRVNGTWGEPELIVETFAGEPTLDNEGNLYFTHHFFKNDVMLEADIYFARKK